MDKKSILEMSRGAIMERVDYELGKVIDNILDVNTAAAKKRKLTITLELTPDDDRTQIAVATQAKSTLVPTTPIVTSLYITGDPQTGEPAVVEMVPQIPGQFSMDGDEQERPNLLKFAQAK